MSRLFVCVIALLALFVVACEARPGASSGVLQPSNAATYAGTYTAYRNTLKVKAMGGDKLQLTWSGLAGNAPNMGDFSSVVKVVNNAAVAPIWDECKVTVVLLSSGNISLKQNLGSMECGFGMGVTVDGEYAKKVAKKPSTVTAYAGTWLSGRNTLRVKTAGSNKVEVSFFGLAGQAANMGEFSATFEVVNGAAQTKVYGDCTVSFQFRATEIELKQSGDSMDCGFGMGVYATGTYTKKATAPVAKKVAAAVVASVASYAGSYSASQNSLTVKSLGGNKLHVSFYGVAGQAGNQGQFEADIKVANGVATVKPYQFGNCVVTFTFANGAIQAKQNGQPMDCGFGNGVYADGNYVKKN